MHTVVVTYFPWLLSALTVYITFLAGSKHKKTWLIGLVSQSLWLTWIVASKTWGFLPLNLTLWVLYYRNHIKWNEKS